MIPTASMAESLGTLARVSVGPRLPPRHPHLRISRAHRPISPPARDRPNTRDWCRMIYSRWSADSSIRVLGSYLASRNMSIGAPTRPGYTCERGASFLGHFDDAPTSKTPCWGASIAQSALECPTVAGRWGPFYFYCAGVVSGDGAEVVTVTGGVGREPRASPRPVSRQQCSPRRLDPVRGVGVTRWPP